MVGVAACQRLDSGCSSPIELGVTPRLALSDAGRLYESQACF
jgi:hypothetical protein